MKPEGVTHFSSPAEFRKWLEDNHSERDEIWVGYWKKGTGRKSVTWPESVDEALCFGWIDGIRKRLSDEAYTIRFTPRRQGSTWSRRNIERYLDMDRLGRITPAGRAAFERRLEEKTATYSYENERPDKLSDGFMKRLEADESVWSGWQAFPPSHKTKVIHWVMSAKKVETRERRLRKLIDDLRSGGA
jgi:uncharacterized protein YdeI (YjbR/CyaY-like superfamily)